MVNDKQSIPELTISPWRWSGDNECIYVHYSAPELPAYRRVVAYVDEEIMEAMNVIYYALCRACVEDYAEIKYKGDIKTQTYMESVKINFDGKTFMLKYKLVIKGEDREFDILSTWADVLWPQEK